MIRVRHVRERDGDQRRYRHYHHHHRHHHRRRRQRLSLTCRDLDRKSACQNDDARLMEQITSAYGPREHARGGRVNLVWWSIDRSNSRYTLRFAPSDRGQPCAPRAAALDGEMASTSHRPCSNRLNVPPAAEQYTLYGGLSDDHTNEPGPAAPATPSAPSGLVPGSFHLPPSTQEQGGGQQSDPLVVGTS